MPGFGIDDGNGLSFSELTGSTLPNPALKFERGGGLSLRWSKANSKTVLSRTIAFDLPAYKADLDGKPFHVCIGAGTCKEFCFARFGNNFNFQNKQINMEANLRDSLTPDFVPMAINDLILLSKTSIEWRDENKKFLGMGTPNSFRIHASGDFYNQAYLNKWFEIMRHLPKLKFYCYTKSLRLNWMRKPKNLLVVQSGGGLWDKEIDFKKHHAIVFRDDAHFKQVNNARRKKGLKLYVYGSEDDIPARRVVPTHIGLVAGVVKGGGAKGKLAEGGKADLYSHGEWPGFWKERMRKNPPELSKEFVTQSGVKHYASEVHLDGKLHHLVFLCELFKGGKHSHKQNYSGKRMVTKECEDCASRHEREVLNQYPNIRPIKENSLVTIVPPLCKCGHNKGIAIGGFGLREEGKALYIDCARCSKSFDGRYARVIKVEEAPSKADIAIQAAKMKAERKKHHGDMHPDEPCAVCRHPFKHHAGGGCETFDDKREITGICMYGDHEFRAGKWEGWPMWLKQIRPQEFGDDEQENPPLGKKLFSSTSEEGGKSICKCTHLGDGPRSQHEDNFGEDGHGACKVCSSCSRFTWAGFRPGLDVKGLMKRRKALDNPARKKIVPLDPRTLTAREKKWALWMAPAMAEIYFYCERCGDVASTSNPRSGLFYCGAEYNLWYCGHCAFRIPKTATFGYPRPLPKSISKKRKDVYGIRTEEGFIPHDPAENPKRSETGLDVKGLMGRRKGRENPRRLGYEKDDKHFNADAYSVSGYKGIAWYVLGWETEPDEDTKWTGIEERTGKVVAVMIGDDRHFSFEESELTPIAREKYCGSCGQIGCTHDGLERNNPSNRAKTDRLGAMAGLKSEQLPNPLENPKISYPNGIKAIYDNGGKTADRYMVYYMEHGSKPGFWQGVGMSEHPFHPQGFGQHTEGMLGSHNGKRIEFSQLPPDPQKLVMRDLREGWNEGKARPLGNPPMTLIGRKCLEIKMSGGFCEGNFGSAYGMADGSAFIKGIFTKVPGGKVKSILYLDEAKAKREGLNPADRPWKHDFSSLDAIAVRVKGGLMLKSKTRLWENR